MRKLGVLFAFILMLLTVPAAANAAITEVFDGHGDIPCSTQVGGSTDGQVWCQGPGGANNAYLSTVRSFDNTPIDVNVGFPDASEFGDGPYPLAMYFHGFGGAKEGFGGDLQRFLDKGIAVFSMTDRGFRNSCGSDGWSETGTYNKNSQGNPEYKDAVSNLQENGEDCSHGFIHLMDTRYEVRDAQYLAGLLADEDVIQPKKIGSVGASYGGGKSMALGALKNRIMNPDGTYSPWKSPEGKDMEIAAAAPIVPWTDFAYALLPNGRTLDYVKDSPYTPPYGVMKSGIVSALLPSGDSFSGEIRTTPQPPLGDFDAAKYPIDPNFDILGWKALMDAGEPYGGTATADLMFNEMTKHHSSYYIDDSVKPAPLLIAQGFTDDLFPIDEPLRYYNRTKAKYPDADISLLFADIGHPRAPLVPSQGRPEDKEMGFQRVDAWFDYYLLGNGPKPVNQVEAKTMVCPYDQPSDGPYTAANWASMSKGEVVLKDTSSQVIKKDGGDLDTTLAFATLGLGACTQADELHEPGVIEYDFPTVPAGGLTLMGAPTVIADITSPNGAGSEIAARLMEVSDGKERVISRGLYRPDASGAQIIQLHGNGYKFPAGSKIRLQLLPKDGNEISLGSYARPSNTQQDITVKDAEIRLPVKEAPGSGNGMVKTTSPKVLPAGAELAGDYSGVGSIPISEWNKTDLPTDIGLISVKGPLKAKGKSVKVKVSCAAKYDECKPGKLIIKGAKNLKKGKGRDIFIGKGGMYVIKPGKSKTVSIKMNAKARKLFRDHLVGPKGGPKRKVKGVKKLRVQVAIYSGKNRAGLKTVIKRVGRIK